MSASRLRDEQTRPFHQLDDVITDDYDREYSSDRSSSGSGPH